MAILSLNNNGQTANVTYLICYLVKFQNATGHFVRNSSWPSVQSPFLQSPLARTVELQAYGYMALVAAGSLYAPNITLAARALWDYMRWYDFGSPQANIIAFKAIAMIYANGFTSFPTDT